MANEKPKNESAESKAQRGYVQYIGTSGRRVISQEDFASVGIKHDHLVWEQANGWKIPRSEISDEAYERAVAPDNELVLMDSEGNRLPQ